MEKDLDTPRLDALVSLAAKLDSSDGILNSKFQVKKGTTMSYVIHSLVAVFTLCACSTQRPVLYPNSYLNQVGAETAGMDINDCIRRADAYVASNNGGRAEIFEGTAISAGTGAAVGAAGGAAGGAVVGRAGTAAAVGAAGGGTAGVSRGLIRGLFRKRAPGTAYKGFVNRCLRDKGYDPIGWN